MVPNKESSCLNRYSFHFQYTDGHWLVSRISQMPGCSDWSHIIIFYIYYVFTNMKLCSVILGYETVQSCRWSPTYSFQPPVTFCVEDLGILSLPDVGNTGIATRWRNTIEIRLSVYPNKSCLLSQHHYVIIAENIRPTCSNNGSLYSD